MYTYYGLMAISAKPKWFAPEIVTGAQIAQMVVGCTVQGCAFCADCGVDKTNLLAGSVMYASYLALFVKFAVERFVLKTFSRGQITKTFSGNAEPSATYWKDPFPTITYYVHRFSCGVRKVVSWPKMAQP